MLDAGQAYRYARGAMWHLEVAIPQLEAIAGGAARSSELVTVAANHLDGAARDLASAAGRATAPIGIDDAAFGAHLMATAAELRASSSAAGGVAEIVRSARHRIQVAVDSIAPHLQSQEDLLGRAPAATAPRSELALIDDVAHARAFKATSDVQRAQIRRILAEGTIDPEPIRMVGGYGNGNGAMPMVRVRHPDTPHLSLVAVHRPPTAQAAQEEFFADLAERARADHHFAPVVRRADGSALVLAIPGGASWEHGIDSGDDIAEVMSSWYRNRFAGLDEDQVRLAGRLDFEEASSLDYIAAQPDRNAGGLLVERSEDAIGYIDSGFAGRGETHDVLRPGLKSHFMRGVAGHVDLHPSAASDLARRLDDEALAGSHAILGRGPDGALPEGHALALRQDASDGYLQAMRARRDQVATGSFDYEPIDLNADPLAHMDWLQGGRRPY